MPIYALGDVAPQIHPDAWVAPTAIIIGNVVLEAGASVWFGAVIRGDNEQIVVGEGANIQDLCCLHSDPGFALHVGNGATVGHGAILHGCTIGENALVGMGATVLNGAELGTMSILGANALLPEGKSLPANMLAVGSPAKPVRELDEQSGAFLRASGAHYVSNANRFRKDLRQIHDRK